jgi:hypothetical protein
MRRAQRLLENVLPKPPEEENGKDHQQQQQQQQQQQSSNEPLKELEAKEEARTLREVEEWLKHDFLVSENDQISPLPRYYLSFHDLPETSTGKLRRVVGNTDGRSAESVNHHTHPSRLGSDTRVGLTLRDLRRQTIGIRKSL